MSGMDRARVRCVMCGAERDLWGDVSPEGFVPEHPEQIRCPTCLNPTPRIVELNGEPVE